MGVMVTRKNRELTDAEIMKIAKAFEDFENGTLQDQKGFTKVATTKEIAKQDYILTPGRYVGTEDIEDDGEAFDDKMKRLTAEIGGLFSNSAKLESEIRIQLCKIGFEVK
jgi:type I restriction enzyme M protein